MNITSKNVPLIVILFKNQFFWEKNIIMVRIFNGVSVITVILVHEITTSAVKNNIFFIMFNLADDIIS